MKKTSIYISIVIVLLSAISIFLPYGDGLPLFNHDETNSIVLHGYSTIFPALSVLVQLVIVYLLSSAKRKGYLIGSIVLSLLNILLLGIIYQQLRMPEDWIFSRVKPGIGFYMLEYCSILIGVISILRVINIRSFLTAKGEFEEIISDEFQQLK